jgi:hypothetical protein
MKSEIIRFIVMGSDLESILSVGFLDPAVFALTKSELHGCPHDSLWSWSLTNDSFTDLNEQINFWISSLKRAFEKPTISGIESVVSYLGIRIAKPDIFLDVDVLAGLASINAGLSIELAFKELTSPPETDDIVKYVIPEPVIYFGTIDENCFFSWLKGIDGVENVVGTPDGLTIWTSKNKFDVYSLRELVALMRRYGLDLTTLKVQIDQGNSAFLTVFE